MKRIYSLFIVCLTLITFSNINGQVYFSENCENGIGHDYSQIFNLYNFSWDTAQGGHTTDKGIPLSGTPPLAQEGDYNYIFFNENLLSSTKLVLPPIDLQFALDPQLRFHYALGKWGQDVDELYIYVKPNLYAEWTEVENYREQQDEWTFQTLYLPDLPYTESTYIAFEGICGWGHGVCVDSITVIETGACPKVPDSVVVSQVSEAEIPSGSTNNPILRLDISVSCNQGSSTLQSVTVNSDNLDDNDIPASGVKLYITNETSFRDPVQVGTAQSLSGGAATFSGLNYNLETGLSHFWVTYDIAADAAHLNTIDAYIPANGINIDNTHYFPVSDSSPSGTATVIESIFFDGFETDKGWVTNGEWEIDAPQGLGNFIGLNPDPDYAHTGDLILGTDITGMGADSGDYEFNIDSSEIWYAESPSINCKYYQDVNVRFYRYLNIDGLDTSTVEYSLDDGSTWNTFVRNDFIRDNKWVLQDISVPEIERQELVKIRFGLGPTNNYQNFSGWNIDDFAVTGDLLEYDVAVTNIISPKTDCDLTATEQVQVEVTNYAINPATPPIRICYSIDGQNVIYDTINQTIPVDGSITFTFTETVDLSQPAIYENAFITTLQDNDEARENDTMKTVIYALPNLVLPNLNPFDEDITFWRSGGDNNSWEYGIPEGAKISSAASGIYVWATNLRGRYNDNENSYIESPCYDLSSADRPILQLKFFTESEINVDGINVLYSIDNGNNWVPIEEHPIYDFGWNWYDSPVSALGENGKSGISAGWETCKVVLPDAIIGQPQVKFRVAFASDDQINYYEGVAIDDIHIYESPVDVGVESIDNLTNACQAENPEQAQITIRNYGIRPIYAGDTMVVGIKLNNEATLIDTFELGSDLLSNGTLSYTFNSRIQLDEVGTQTIRSFTLIENDPLFYATSNDTSSVTVDIIQSPITLLADTIATNSIDTVTIRPLYNANYSYLWNDGDTERIKDTLFFGTYVVTVTDELPIGNGCQTMDTVRVQWLFSDVGLSSILSPVNDCELDPVTNITLGVKNYGNDTIKPGTKVVAAFHLDSGAVVYDTITIDTEVWPQDVYPYTFANDPVDLSGKDKYHILAYTLFQGDTINNNDTTMKYVSAHGYPSVEIGPDTVYHRGSYKVYSAEVTGGSGSSTNPDIPSFIWKDSTTSTNYIAREIGEHWVTYTDKYGCSDSDTSYLQLLIRDIGPVQMTAPVTQCGVPGEVAVVVDFYNYGTDTVKSGSRYPLAYNMTYYDRITDELKLAYNPIVDTIVLAADVLPGGSFSHTFYDKAIEGEGKYSFVIYLKESNDVNAVNDTIDSVAVFMPQPSVFLPKDASGWHYIYDSKSYLFKVFISDSNFYPTWQDGSHADTFLVVRPTGGLIQSEYFVTVEDTTTGCFDRDTTNILFLVSDVELMDVITGGAQVCASDFSSIDVVIRNVGDVSLDTKNGDVYLYYTYNNGDPVRDTIILAPPYTLAKNNTAVHTIDNIDIIAFENLDFKFYLDYKLDVEPENDTVNKTVEIKKSPYIDFGGDTITGTFPHQLDAAQTEQSDYKWNDGSIGENYTVRREGYYEVTIEYLNGCSGTFGVYVKESTGIGTTEFTNEIIVYPNPAKEIINIDFVQKQDRDVQILLIDMTGKVIRNTIFEKESAETNIQMDIDDLVPGMYFLHFRNEDRASTAKVVIE